MIEQRSSVYILHWAIWATALPDIIYIYIYMYHTTYLVPRGPPPYRATRKRRTGRLRFNGQYNRLENGYFSSKPWLEIGSSYEVADLPTYLWMAWDRIHLQSSTYKLSGASCRSRAYTYRILQDYKRVTARGRISEPNVYIAFSSYIYVCRRTTYLAPHGPPVTRNAQTSDRPVEVQWSI